ncbi:MULTISPECIES: helix-turn-helix domain-containing protein [Streptomyces violaceusniger group]|uniref:Helix-turn-helix transcriptional regulator n=1 Tax=Streptomyces rhizosphaericus TaxID=114699 RepID=A0ABN1PXJ4_9ACTN|nr:helix-turn-helix transcriptional regulator [Streptomyces cangkringensis]
MAAVTSGSPLSARRRLATELRLLRDQHDLTTEEVGAHLNCHNSKVSRIETAKRVCTKKDFDGLMELYEVEEPKLSELKELLTRARQRIPPWWYAYNDVISANYAEFLAYEAEAMSCFEYQPLLIPGLLQTEGYARAVTGVSYAALGPDQVDSLVEVRMRRQERLREEAPLFLDAVVTEAALHLLVGGRDVMQAQLGRLLDVSALDHVRLKVIPFQAGEKGASTGAFTLFGTGKNSDADDVAFTESAENTTAFRDDPLAIRRLSRLFANLSGAALSEEASRELVEHIKEELIRDE